MNTSSTPSPKDRLLERIGEINDFSRPRPLVSLEDFFEDNDDPGSFGYNLPFPPGPQVFFRFLREIRERPDVIDVLIEVKDHEDPGAWPSADTIHIITDAPSDLVVKWFPADLAPDEWGSNTSLGPPAVEAWPVPQGMRAVFAFYD